MKQPLEVIQDLLKKQFSVNAPKIMFGGDCYKIDNQKLDAKLMQQLILPLEIIFAQKFPQCSFKSCLQEDEHLNNLLENIDSEQHYSIITTQDGSIIFYHFHKITDSEMLFKYLITKQQQILSSGGCQLSYQQQKDGTTTFIVDNNSDLNADLEKITSIGFAYKDFSDPKNDCLKRLATYLLPKIIAPQFFRPLSDKASQHRR